MKLLTKREVDQAKALDRKREMDEGLKLARKVDALRELLPAEEAALEKFRTETLTAIQAELKPAQEELTTTLQALAAARAELIVARKPLDEEWEEAIKTSRVVEEADREAKEVLAQARKDAQVALNDRHLAEMSARAAQETENIARNLFGDATRKHQAAADTLTDATKVHDAALKLKYDTEILLQDREQRVAHDENRNTMWEERLRREEGELRKQERLLADRQALFERNLKRNLN